MKAWQRENLRNELRRLNKQIADTKDYFLLYGTTRRRDEITNLLSKHKEKSDNREPGDSNEGA